MGLGVGSALDVDAPSLEHAAVRLLLRRAIVERQGHYRAHLVRVRVRVRARARARVGVGLRWG